MTRQNREKGSINTVSIVVIVVVDDWEVIMINGKFSSTTKIDVVYDWNPSLGDGRVFGCGGNLNLIISSFLSSVMGGTFVAVI